MRSLGGWKQSRRWGGWGGGNVRNEVGGSGKWKWGETVLSYVTIIWKSWRSTFVSSLGPKDSLQYLLLLLLILSLLLLLSSILKLITICAISRYIHNRNTILLTRFITHDSRANHYVRDLTYSPWVNDMPCQHWWRGSSRWRQLWRGGDDARQHQNTKKNTCIHLAF